MKLAVKNTYGEEKAVLIENNQIIGLFIKRPERLNLNDEVDGIIKKYDYVLKGYFVETQKKLSVFVRSDKIWPEGTRVCVKITKEARRGKDANGVFIESKQGENTLAQQLKDKYSADFLDNWCDDFDEAFEEALNSTIQLKNGVILHIERTQTCWTIDVDSGNCTDSAHDLNVKIVPDIVRQIKLRHLGGIILIDFIGSKHKKEQNNLINLLIKELKNDSLSVILGWTRGKLFEIKRARTYAPLADTFLDSQNNPLPLTTIYQICDTIKSCKSVPTVTVHPNIANILREKLNNRIHLKTNMELAPYQFDIKE